MTRKQWNNLFGSDASLFESDEAFADAHRQLHTELAGVSDNLRPQLRRPGARNSAYILQLDGCDTACHKTIADTVGRKRYSMRTGDVVQVSASADVMESMSKGPLAGYISDFFPLLAKLKYEPVLPAEIDKTCQSGSNTFSLSISLVPVSQGDLLNVVNLLIALSVDVREEALHPDEMNFVVVTGSCADASAILEGVAAIAEVDWIEQAKEFILYNRWAKSLIQTGDEKTKDTPIFDANITGHGQIVGVVDTGLDMQSCYFHDDNRKTPYRYVDLQHRKVVLYYNLSNSVDDFNTGHGTHVSGIVAGKATVEYGTFHDFDGHAPGAKLAFFDVGRRINGNDVLQPPGNLDTELFRLLYAAGARIMSNSWGERTVTNAYDNNARSIDNFMYLHPDALVIFAAGNEGSLGLNSVTAPSTNKNGISVGASHNSADAWKSARPLSYKSTFIADGMADFSSIGPVRDRRLKPDLVAPGAPIYSADSEKTAQCAAKLLQGTSMACPAVAASAALVRQYFVEGYYPYGDKNTSLGFIPSGALLKAMLIHSGTKINRIVYDDGDTFRLDDYPSVYQGWGRVTLKNVLNFAEVDEKSASLFVRGAAFPDSEYYVQLEFNGDWNAFHFTTDTDEEAPLRITLAYTEPPAGSVTSSTSAQVHVLKLVVTNQDTGIVTQAADAPGTEGNNVFVIDIASPGLNVSYTVNVSAILIGSDQPYALVVTGKVSPYQSVANATTTSEASVRSDSIGITRNLMTVLVILGLACVILLVVLYLIKRENNRYIKLYVKAAQANTRSYPDDAPRAKK